MNDETARFFRHLIVDCEYIAPFPINETYYVTVQQLLFTHAVIVGRIGDWWGYSFRWCYPTKTEAQIAIAEWMAKDWSDEPKGYIRRVGAVPAPGELRPDLAEVS